MHRSLFLTSIFILLLLATFSTAISAGENINKKFQAKSYPGSRDRDYIVHLPNDYDRTKSIPLVMVLHGCSQTNQTIQHDTNFDAIADKEGFAVVYPFITSYQGLRNTNCWGFWFDEEIHEGAGEVQDLAEIIKEIQADYTIDKNRIHVTGLSSGAAMAIDVMVAHSEIIASGSETAGLAYSETAASVGFSCGNPGSFKPVSSVVNEMGREMSVAQRPVPLFIAHSLDDCTVNIQAAENIRDSWGQLFGIDTLTPSSTESGNTLGTPWTHNKYNGNDGKSLIETLFIRGKNHGWYGGRDGQFAFKDAPNTAQLMWNFFKAHPLNSNELPMVMISQLFVSDERCITVSGVADDNDGQVESVAIAFEGLFPQASQPAEFNGQEFTYTACQLRNNASYTPLVTVTDDKGGMSSIRGQAIVVGELPANTPPTVTISKESVDGACVVLEGTATDDKRVAVVEVSIDGGGRNEKSWEPAKLDGSSWRYEVCNLQPGEYRTQVRVLDEEKLATSLAGKGVVIEAGFDVVESANLTDHLLARRIRNYPSGFGAADKSYLDLLNLYGVNQAFLLYGTEDGWYVDVSNIPITSELRQTLSNGKVTSQDSCLSVISPDPALELEPVLQQARNSQPDLNLETRVSLQYRIGDNPWQAVRTGMQAFGENNSLAVEQCGLSDGVHSIGLRAMNSDGQSSQVTNLSQRIGGNQPPYLRVKENFISEDCIVLSGEASDDALVKKVMVSIDGAHWENAAVRGEYWYFDRCGLVEVPENVRVRAIDGWAQFSEKVMQGYQDIEN